jgi:hypothetical protein
MNDLDRSVSDELSEHYLLEYIKVERGKQAGSKQCLNLTEPVSDVRNFFRAALN